MAEHTEEYRAAYDLISKLQAEVEQLKRENGQMQEKIKCIEDAENGSSLTLPDWFDALKEIPNFKYRLEVREWEDPVWRAAHPNEGGGGWRGTDYVHCPKAAGVRVLDYLLFGPSGDASTPAGEQGIDYSLVGVAHFTEKAESHVGLCHGGSMCALMDDVVGWLGFCADGELKPWSGFTVQIDTALKKAVHVGSLLRLEATVTERVGKRKVYIKAKLVDPSSPDVVYCTCSGLFLVK